MTLIVGIQCSDGVVIAADSAVTLGSVGGPTIAQQGEKLSIVGGKVIIGCSGPLGLAQRIVHEVETIWQGSQLSGKNAVQAGVIIGNAIKPHILSEANVAQYMARISPTAAQNAIVTAVIALPVSKKVALIEFNENGGPEVATVPFVAIGSGKPLADPFLGFLRRIFWPSTEPTLAEGTFAAVWTLDQCIRTSPAFLAQPVRVAELRKDGNSFAAAMLEKNDLAEHRQNIDAAEKALASWKIQKTADVEPPPSP